MAAVDRSSEEHRKKHIAGGARQQKKNKSAKQAVKSDEKPEKSTGYKRSDSKYRKSTDERPRSNPRCEYCLDDADQNEKELVLNGTVTDRLTCLALLCARNPSEQNYKQLLQFCENQRNDVVYETIKHVRDLVKENPSVSPYIRSRIVKSLEMGARNHYIKDKVVVIIGVLVRAGIFSEDLVNVLISRLIEKGPTLKLVEDALKSVFSIHEELIFAGIEDFYYKNDSFRCQYNALKFLQGLEVSNRPETFCFYDQALASLDEYPQDQKDLMIEIIVNWLSKTVSEGDKVTSIELVRGYVKTARSIISVLNLLMKTKDPYTESYVLRVSRTTLLRNSKHEPSFLNMVYQLDNKDLFAKLVNNSFYHSVQSILALMLMANEKRVDGAAMFSLCLFSLHHNSLVRDIAGRILRSERLPQFDPFDSVHVEGLARMLDSR